MRPPHRGQAEALIELRRQAVAQIGAARETRQSSQDQRNDSNRETRHTLEKIPPRREIERAI